MMDELVKIIEEMGIPFAYDHFAEGESPDPPFLCYLLPGSDNFAADGRVYYKMSEVRIELYTDFKDVSLEEKVTAVLDNHGIFYEQSEVWIEEEKLYEVAFEFAMPV
nr:MAG TPA: tail completion protein [Caudoviricetes sp.]